LHLLVSNIFATINVSLLVPNTHYLFCLFFIIEANNIPLVSIISCKIGGCYYYCYYCYTFAYNLFCEDDYDENLVFDGVKDCGELVGIVGGEELGEGELEFSKDSIEGFSLLVKLGEALVWCFL
jgi:hypothetical protein